MYSQLSLQPNSDGTYDLIIQYDRTADAEFPLDFLSGKQAVLQGYQSVADFLKKKGSGLKVRSAKILIGGLVVAVLPISMMLGSYAASQKYSMGYVYFGPQTQQMQTVEASSSALDTIAPSLLDIRSDGTVKYNTPPVGMIEGYQGMGLRVVPFLSNHWDRAAGVAALQDPQALAEQVADLVEQNGLDGVNVDIENVTHTERDQYAEFVEILRELLPPEKEVSVAVAANPWGFTTGWHGSYDYQRLADASDYLMLMTYDEHYEGGEPGAVASIGFVEDAVEYALQYAPPEKIVIGLPLFGRVWGGGGAFNGNGAPLDQIDEMIALYGATVTYDEDAQSPKADFTVKASDPKLSIYGKALVPGSYEVWFENDRSILAKLDLADQYDLKGTGSWAVGQQSDQVWEAYQSWIDGYDYVPQEPEPPEEIPDTAQPPATGGGSSSTGSRPGGGSSGGSSSGGGGGGGGGGSFSGGGLFTGASTSQTTAQVQTPNTPAAALGYTGRVTNAEGTVLRAGPSEKQSTVATLGQGTRYTYLSKSGDWYKVRLSDGKTGYLPIADQSLYSVGVVTSNGVKVLSSLESDAQVLASPAAGTPVTILETRSDGWRRVRLADDTTGYVQSSRVSNSPYKQEIIIRETTVALKLRDVNDPQNGSYGTLPAGEKVLSLGTENGYQKISWGTVTAYVSDGYFR